MSLSFFLCFRGKAYVYARISSQEVKACVRVLERERQREREREGERKCVFTFSQSKDRCSGDRC